MNKPLDAKLLPRFPAVGVESAVLGGVPVPLRGHVTTMIKKQFFPLVKDTAGFIRRRTHEKALNQ